MIRSRPTYCKYLFVLALLFWFRVMWVWSNPNRLLCLNEEMNQGEITGIRIRRFRMYCAIQKNLRTQSQFKYRANVWLLSNLFYFPVFCSPSISCWNLIYEFVRWILLLRTNKQNLGTLRLDKSVNSTTHQSIIKILGDLPVIKFLLSMIIFQSVMVDEVGLAELAEQKMKEKLPR